MNSPEVIHGPKIITLRAYAEVLRLIDNGRKSVEIRVRDPRVEEVAPGDYLMFERSNVSDLLITRVANYDNIEEAMRNEDPRRVMPGFTLNEIVRYFKLSHSPERRKKSVVAMEWDPEKRYKDFK